MHGVLSSGFAAGSESGDLGPQGFLVLLSF